MLLQGGEHIKWTDRWRMCMDPAGNVPWGRAMAENINRMDPRTKPGPANKQTIFPGPTLVYPLPPT